MECIKVLVISLLFITGLNAQFDSKTTAIQDTTNSLNVEGGIGFNFINNFLPTDNGIGEESPFQFYINTWKGAKVRRVALSLDIGGSVEKIDDDRTFTTNGFGTSIRLGSGKRRSISDRLHFVSGGDFLLGFDYESQSIKDDMNFQVNNSRNSFTTEVGGGFFAGVQFQMTPRLSLYTEMSYLFVLDYTAANLKFDSDNRDDEKESKFSYGTRYSAPSYLVLFYRF